MLYTIRLWKYDDNGDTGCNVDHNLDNDDVDDADADDDYLKDDDEIQITSST